jgi:hypothetical protein
MDMGCGRSGVAGGVGVVDARVTWSLPTRNDGGRFVQPSFTSPAAPCIHLTKELV